MVVAVQVRKPGSTPIALTSNIPAVQESPSQSVRPGAEAVPGADRARSAHSESVIPELLSPQEGTTLANGQSEFRWTKVRRALFYEVEVLTPDGNIAWTGRTQGTQVSLARQATLKEGKFFVWVRAHLVDGKTSKSRAVSFQISPAQ